MFSVPSSALQYSTGSLTDEDEEEDDYVCEYFFGLCGKTKVVSYKPSLVLERESSEHGGLKIDWLFFTQ